MTEGNQLRRLFCRHNTSDPSNCQHVTLGHLSGDNKVQDLWCQMYYARSNGFSVSHWLFGDVHHTSASLCINVTESLHRFLKRERKYQSRKDQRRPCQTTIRPTHKCSFSALGPRDLLPLCTLRGRISHLSLLKG